MFAEVARDLFTFPDRYYRVIPVNCVGVMGAGIARQFKAREPGIFEDYRGLCEAGQVTPGSIHVIITEDAQVYVLAATKNHWKYPSRKAWVTQILDHIKGLREHPSAPIHIALPPIGCGLGGLSYDWLYQEVKDRFADHPTVNVALIRPR